MTNHSVDMDVDYTNKGYGYSVWYVPENYKELQDIYKISHIPHITLETNLLLRDAYHIYHNACPDITIKFKEKYVRFPSFYDNDPLISYGWYVDVIKMTRRKLNWVPHMTLKYLQRSSKNSNSNIDKSILSDYKHPPSNEIKCKVIIADTRGNEPVHWHVNYKYFNVKVSHSYGLSFGLNRKSYPLSATSVDEYYGTDMENFPLFKKFLYDDLITKGVQMNEIDFTNMIKGIEKELDNTSQSMEIDNPTIHKIR